MNDTGYIVLPRMMLEVHPIHDWVPWYAESVAFGFMRFLWDFIGFHGNPKKMPKRVFEDVTVQCFLRSQVSNFIFFASVWGRYTTYLG